MVWGGRGHETRNTSSTLHGYPPGTRLLRRFEYDFTTFCSKKPVVPVLIAQKGALSKLREPFPGVAASLAWTKELLD